MNQDTLLENLTDAQIKNWENFCHYHGGEWHGTWNIYNPEGILTRAYQCIRSFHVSSNASEVSRQNYYIYADGTTKLENFETRKKPLIKGLFLDNSFSWGSTTVTPGSTFFFETGFRHEDRRGSAVSRYNENGTLDVLIIPEHLSSFADTSPYYSVNEFSSKCQGTIKKMTPDWIVSPIVANSWMQLERLAEDYLTLHLADNISVNIPRQIESGKEFCLTTQWLVKPTLMYRGTRHFDASGFTRFTLEVFKC
ncbi:DUF3598 family protein [Nostoc sp. B(2019)]|nr:DUF3598 family protein [Nostoc sp. B(2019)]